MYFMVSFHCLMILEIQKDTLKHKFSTKNKQNNEWNIFTCNHTVCK